jgi:predicted membrane channel-forming protein YqfA (hemolysin III family)
MDLPLIYRHPFLLAPVMPSLVSYLTGLAFYASHAPECFLSEKWCHRLDLLEEVREYPAFHITDVYH